MDKVYVVKEHYQENDGESWHWWIEERLITIHKTEEGANNKKKALILERYENYQNDSYAMQNPGVRLRTLERLRDNKVELVDSHGVEKLVDLFFIKEIELLD